jgi:hypothetical protein
MTINLLYGCCQIETCARDLAATRRFMVDKLGAGPAEQSLAREIAQIIPDPAYDVDHLECGQAIFQINQPSPTMTYNGQPSVHQSYLDRVGSCVTNLNFFIDDYAHAHALLSGIGAETYIRGPSSAARSLADYGADNTRPGADERPFLFMGTRGLIGFDLEIMEPNFLHFSKQRAQYPAFVSPRPKTGDGNLRLERLLVVVDRLEVTLDNLEVLFAPASRSNVYTYRDGTLGRSFRITLGGIEIQYCQPVSDSGFLANTLSRFGPGVAAIEFAARNTGHVVRNVTADSAIVFEEAFEPLGLVADRPGYRLGCRALTGFDVVLTPGIATPFRS